MQLTLESIVAIVAIVTALFSFFAFVWRMALAFRSFMKSNGEMKEAIATIKKEVTPNGGSSIKDFVLQLYETCERIELIQKVIDQRSRAALHYQHKPLFEIDKKGNLVWANDAFCNSVAECGDISGGLDWISIVEEHEREQFLKELNSCLEISRKLDVIFSFSKGGKIKMVGYPYRTEEEKNEGFLIHTEILENENGFA